METLKISSILSSDLTTKGHVLTLSGKAGHAAKPHVCGVGAILLL